MNIEYYLMKSTGKTPELVAEDSGSFATEFVPRIGDSVRITSEPGDCGKVYAVEYVRLSLLVRVFIE